MLKGERGASLGELPAALAIPKLQCRYSQGLRRLSQTSLDPPWKRCPCSSCTGLGGMGGRRCWDPCWSFSCNKRRVLLIFFSILTVAWCVSQPCRRCSQPWQQFWVHLWRLEVPVSRWSWCRWPSWHIRGGGVGFLALGMGSCSQPEGPGCLPVIPQDSRLESWEYHMEWLPLMPQDPCTCHSRLENWNYEMRLSIILGDPCACDSRLEN